MVKYKKGQTKPDIDWQKLRSFILNEGKNKSTHITKLNPKNKYNKIFQKFKPKYGNNRTCSVCPYDIKQEIIHQLCSSITSTKESLLAKNKPLKFEMNKRDKNRLRKSVTIPLNAGNASVSWDDSNFYFLKSMIDKVKVKKRREITKLNQNYIDGKYIRKPIQKEDSDQPSKYIAEARCPFTLKYESPGKYYIIITIVKQVQGKKPEAKDFNYISFDPGVKTFQTGINQNGDIIEIGKHGINKICNMARKMSKFQSKIDSANTNKDIIIFRGKHRYRKYRDKFKNKEYSNETKKNNEISTNYKIKKRTKSIATQKKKQEKQKVNQQRKRNRNKKKRQKTKYKKTKRRITNRIENLKRGFHWELSNKLTREYHHIIISKFQVSNMTNKLKRNISKECVKLMLNWSHFKFRQKLKEKAQETNSIVHEVSEHYTSKTCSNCGNINWNLGNNRVYKCKICKFESGRDWQAAKNILLKNFDEIGFKLK
jgi:transposase